MFRKFVFVVTLSVSLFSLYIILCFRKSKNQSVDVGRIRVNDINCILFPDERYLYRPHGINNQILLFSTIFLDLRWIAEERDCKIFIRNTRMFVSHYGISNFFLPFERVFDTKLSDIFLSAKEFELSQQANFEHIRVSYDILRTRNYGKVVTLLDKDKKLLIEFSTKRIYDGSIPRWFAYGFVLPSKWQMMQFLQRNIFLNVHYHGILEHVLTNNMFDMTYEKLKKETLVVHLRYAPHCISTGSKGAFGEWFEAFYTCNPTHEQVKTSIKEVLFLEKSINRIIFLSANESHPTTTSLLEDFPAYDPIIGSSLFEIKVIQEMYYPNYVYDLVEYLILEESYAHLSTSFISTYSLVGAMRRGFRRSYFVRPFGFTFGRAGGFCFLGKVIALGILVFQVVKAIRARKGATWKMSLENLKKVVMEKLWMTSFWIFVLVFVVPIFVELVLACFVAIYLFQYVRFAKAVLGILNML